MTDTDADTHTHTELPAEARGDAEVTAREARALGLGPRRRRRRWPWVLLAFVVIVVLALGAAFLWVQRQLDPPGDPGEVVRVTIPPGTGATGIADLLAEEGIIANSLVFQVYVRLNDEGDWQAGVYRMREDSSVSDVVETLDAGPAAPPARSVTVPEGLSVFAGAGLPAPGSVVQRLVDPQDGIPRFREDRIMALLLSGDLRSRYLPQGVDNLEGFLFPDTYEVRQDENERAVLGRMIDRFDQVGQEVGLGQATQRILEATGGRVRLTRYQAVIVASLIEREARVPEERPMMARVIYNRLADATALGIDASLNYALGHPATTESDLATDSPYNLREVAGLPPTPIAVPGQASLAAALNPAPGEWRYYVLSDEAGHHTFTETYDEFLDAKAQCQAAGLC